MSENFRNEFAYWFFLIAGIAGVGYQMYEFFTGHIEFSVSEIGVTAFFSVFIFKPTILVDLFTALKGLTKKRKGF